MWHKSLSGNLRNDDDFVPLDHRAVNTDDEVKEVTISTESLQSLWVFLRSQVLSFKFVSWTLVE